MNAEDAPEKVYMVFGDDCGVVAVTLDEVDAHEYEGLVVPYTKES